MRSALLALLVAALARTQETRIDDPAALLPRGTSILVEASDVAGAAARLRNAIAALSPESRPETPAASRPTTRKSIGLVPDLVSGFETMAGEKLTELEKAGVKRLAFGVSPVLMGDTRYILVAETGDPPALDALIARWAGETKLVSRDFPPFRAFADSEASLDIVGRIRDGKDRPLTEREEFRKYRSRAGGGVLGFYTDLGKMLPPMARVGVLKKDDVGAVFFASHYMFVAKTARVLFGSLGLSGGVTLDLFAEIDPVTPLRAFTETRPTQPVLQPPEGCVARLSLSRDLKQFWNDREKLLDEKARSSFAEFQTNLGVLMGGMTVEDLFAGLGSAFDVYVTRGSGGEPGHRYPGAALVAVLADPALRAELLLSFQTTMGIVNAQRAQENQPRFFQESVLHRDVLIACARSLPASFADPEDARLQLEPSFATVKDRVILGSNRAIVRALVDQALDGKTRPRAPGDEIEATGPDAAAALLDAAAIVRSQLVLKKGHTEESARDLVESLASILALIERGRAAFHIDGTLATQSIRIGSEKLFQARPESR